MEEADAHGYCDRNWRYAARRLPGRFSTAQALAEAPPIEAGTSSGARNIDPPVDRVVAELDDTGVVVVNVGDLGDLPTGRAWHLLRPDAGKRPAVSGPPAP